MRPLAVAGAALGWAALALQLWLSIGLAIGNHRGAAWGVFMYLGYFTILTNLLVALALTAAATRSEAAAWRFLRGPGVASAIAANIAIVGLVYFFVLRHIWAPRGLAWLADVLLHYAMPLLYLAWWWLAVPARGLSWRDIPRWWAYPLGYLAYALVRGEIAGVYPYPFIDVGALGYERALINAVGVALGFSVMAALLIAIGRLKPTPQDVAEQGRRHPLEKM
ncbi:Pr6Pr family membrane protein [Variovorax sp. KK3]|uniref:Pr6Pr family membrane protein n=1 Tax=Variovorax sp. KK3 TaxID=1855728 RepID=UPI00097BC179|nr:Pr6Pr family membrane protein [Variovorax sp. KK3]